MIIVQTTYGFHWTYIISLDHEKFAIYQCTNFFSLKYILEEADLDDDGALSFAEFEHIIDKSIDFTE